MGTTRLRAGLLTNLLIGLLAAVNPIMAQAGGRTPPERTPQVTSPTARPAPPTRDPNTAGFVTAKELPDGSVPPVDADGNFVIGPTHTPAFEMVVHEGVPRGTVHTFTMSSADSKIFPGIARDSGTFGTVSPTDPATLVVTTSHPAPYTRTVAVYVPAQYVPGTIAPFIIGADGPDQSLFTALDNLIAEKRVPAMIAISIGNGSGDAQGSERSLEYDTMSGRYAEFVETEVLPLVERQYNVRLTKDPEGRATMGGSSGGSAAFIMAWYHPELYHRVLAYSITAINQQWPHSDETPHGAWEFHERLIPNSPAKPIRVWMEVGDRDFFNPNVMRDGMHDWVVASENMAKVLAGKGYHYQFVFARNAVHVDRGVKQQTLPEALEWLWRGYPFEGSKSSAQVNPDWTEPFPPFRVAGNLYYVGSKDLATYLITTPKGHILINSDLETSVPLIRASVERLGFKFSDIKILLISHAHWDHDGGSAAIKGLTGATYMVMDADVSVVESGGKTDFQYGNQPASLYPPAKVDRVLHDGDEVRLGGVTLVAHLTPGHTKGCTTWTMKVEEAGKIYDVVIVGSPNVNEGYKLVGNSLYPEIASDYERTFRVLKSLPVDIFLGAHGDYFDLLTKYARLKEGAVTPFIDPAGYKRYITEREEAFRTELAKQKAALRQ